MSRLRTYAPMKRTAKPWPTAAPQITRQTPTSFTAVFSGPAPGVDPVYAAVDARSEGRCEVDLGARCPKPAQDHHHTRKPRRRFHDPDHVIAICRTHHDRCDFPYARGRLVIRGLGAGVFECAIVTAPDKFTYRHQEGTQ